MEDYNLDDYRYTGNGNPAVYVGTYHKYNCGSIFGAWIDLTKFYDYEEFIDVCRDLHCDEEDPELMAQDYENFPEAFYTEGFISEEQFDKIREFADLSDDDKEMYLAYMEWQNGPDDIESIREICRGKWDSEEEFAQDLVLSCGLLDGVSDMLANYFDYEKFTRDLFCGDYYFDGTYVWECF